MSEDKKRDNGISLVDDGKSLKDLYPRFDPVVVGTVELTQVELTLAQQDEISEILLGQEIGTALEPIGKVIKKFLGDNTEGVIKVDLQQVLVENSDGLLTALRDGLRPLMFRCSRKMAAVALDNEANRDRVAKVLGKDALELEKRPDGTEACHELRAYVASRVTQAQFSYMLDVVAKQREWLNLGKRILASLPIAKLFQLGSQTLET